MSTPHQIPFFPSEKTLAERYPGAPLPFIRAFVRSGKSMRHFTAMRQAWSDAISYSIELTRGMPATGMLTFQLYKDI